MIINAKTFEVLLRLCGLTRTSLSRRAGVGVKTIDRIGRGAALRASSGERIAAALGVSREVLEAPPSKALDRKARDIAKRRKLEMAIDTAALNALRLTAIRYGLEEQWIIEIAPYVVTVLAELSLKRRRDAVEAWKQTSLDALERGPETRPWSPDPCATIDSLITGVWEIYDWEVASIAQRDLSGGFSGEHPEGADEKVPGHPFFTMLEALAREGGGHLDFSGRTSAEPPRPFWYDVLYETARDFLDPKDGTPIDESLLSDILLGRISLDGVP